MYGTPAMHPIERRQPVGGDEQPLVVAAARTTPRTLPSRRSASGRSIVGERLEQCSCASAHMLPWRTPTPLREQPQAEVLRPPPRRRVRVLAGDDVVLGVRHQAEHDAGRVAHAGDVGDRAVRVGAAVAQRDLAGGGERVRVGVHVAALAVGDRAVDRRRRARRSRRTLDSGCGCELDPPAVEAAVGVVAERARAAARRG